MGDEFWQEIGEWLADVISKFQDGTLDVEDLQNNPFSGYLEDEQVDEQTDDFIGGGSVAMSPVDDNFADGLVLSERTDIEDTSSTLYMSVVDDENGSVVYSSNMSSEVGDKFIDTVGNCRSNDVSNIITDADALDDYADNHDGLSMVIPFMNENGTVSGTLNEYGDGTFLYQTEDEHGNQEVYMLNPDDVKESGLDNMMTALGNNMDEYSTLNVNEMDLETFETACQDAKLKSESKVGCMVSTHGLSATNFEHNPSINDDKKFSTYDRGEMDTGVSNNMISAISECHVEKMLPENERGSFELEHGGVSTYVYFYDNNRENMSVLCQYEDGTLMYRDFNGDEPVNMVLDADDAKNLGLSQTMDYMSVQGEWYGETGGEVPTVTYDDVRNYLNVDETNPINSDDYFDDYNFYVSYGEIDEHKGGSVEDDKTMTNMVDGLSKSGFYVNNDLDTSDWGEPTILTFSGESGHRGELSIYENGKMTWQEENSDIESYDYGYTTGNTYVISPSLELRTAVNSFEKQEEKEEKKEARAEKQAQRREAWEEGHDGTIISGLAGFGPAGAIGLVGGWSLKDDESMYGNAGIDDEMNDNVESPDAYAIGDEVEKSDSSPEAGQRGVQATEDLSDSVDNTRVISNDYDKGMGE